MKIFLIKSNTSESGTIETLPKFEPLQIIVEQNSKKLESVLKKNEKVAIISESSIVDILSHLPQNNPKRNAIELFKDKFLFRRLVKDEDFNVQKINFQDISKIKIMNKSVLKPLKGCFGTAVKIIDENTNFENIKKEIQKDIDKNGTLFSTDVLTSDEFIIEDFIEGEEYAVDMFYNNKGKPCIVNILFLRMSNICI